MRLPRSEELVACMVREYPGVIHSVSNDTEVWIRFAVPFPGLVSVQIHPFPGHGIAGAPLLLSQHREHAQSFSRHLLSHDYHQLFPNSSNMAPMLLSVCRLLTRRFVRRGLARGVLAYWQGSAAAGLKTGTASASPAAVTGTSAQRSPAVRGGPGGGPALG